MGDEYALTVTEKDRLYELEDVIERGVRTFIDVGQALSEIRNNRLYRDDYATFDEYCLDKWGITDRHGRRLMGAAETFDNLKSGPMGPVLPTTERQARPLTRLEPEQQRKAWQTAVETAPNGKVTAAHVDKVVEEIAPRKHAVHFSSETGKHNTPPEIIEAVVTCLGKIDLDPCSNEGEPNVPAEYHLTVADDGLTHPWLGTVYMNPPYGNDIGKWVEKLCLEHELGHAVKAIALVPARTDTQWWKQLRDYPVCLIEGRLRFGDAENSAPFPSAVFYLGEAIDGFFYSFQHLGDVWQRIEPGMFVE